jgi:hypothetical protein
MGLRLASYSETPDQQVDPKAWNAYDASHAFGLGLGSMLDWRPLRDARLRPGLSLWTTPEIRLDWAEALLRLDLLPLPRTQLSLTPAVGYRFQEPARIEAYWRPRLAGHITHTAFVARYFRIQVGAFGQWLPLQDMAEGRLVFQVETSPSRGLRDHSPLDIPFQSTLDLPLETP